jgi:hypothetical protein
LIDAPSENNEILRSKFDIQSNNSFDGIQYVECSRDAARSGNLMHLSSCEVGCGLIYDLQRVVSRVGGRKRGLEGGADPGLGQYISRCLYVQGCGRIKWKVDR